MNLINIRAIGGAETAGEAKQMSELDHLIWFANSSLHDLQAALGTAQSITETQLNDLRTIVQQSQSALSRGLRVPRRTT